MLPMRAQTQMATPLTIAAWLLAGLLSMYARADSPSPTATYVGPAVCLKCHAPDTEASQPPRQQSGLFPKDAALVRKFIRAAHASTLIDARQSPEKIVAHFTPESPLRREEIAFAIGAGRHEQRYCDVSMKTLPFRWDSVGNKWATERVVDAVKECLGCHATGLDVASGKWLEHGVTCESCHGPGSLHAAGDKARIVNPASLPKERQAMICGQCHAKGTSTDRSRPFPIGFRPGDDLTKHYMIEPPSVGTQVTELRSSKHFAKDVVCTTCHDPHGPVAGTVHQLRKPINALCLGCHADHVIDRHAPEAPARATCNRCHMPSGSHAFKAPPRRTPVIERARAERETRSPK